MFTLFVAFTYFSKFKLKNDCQYLGNRCKGHNHRKGQYMTDLIEYSRKIIPYIYFYKQQIKSLNNIAYDILDNKRSIILPKFLENRNVKAGVFIALILGF